VLRPDKTGALYMPKLFVQPMDLGFKLESFLSTLGSSQFAIVYGFSLHIMTLP